METINHKKDALILVPGFSPKLDPVPSGLKELRRKLEYDIDKNPYGYGQIHVFDTYDYEEYFKEYLSIPELADELYKDICGDDGWALEDVNKIDFLGHSMGGLIIRAMIKKYFTPPNIISFERMSKALDGQGKRIFDVPGKMKVTRFPEQEPISKEIGTVLTLATPNKGTLIGDKIPYNPVLRFLAWFPNKITKIYNNAQAKGVRIGDQPVVSKWLRCLIKRKSPKNHFLDELNQQQTYGSIKWVTIAGTRWCCRFFIMPLLIHGPTINDSVVEMHRVELDGATNITDKNWDFRMDHAQSAKCKKVCNLVHAVLIHNWEPGKPKP